MRSVVFLAVLCLTSGVDAIANDFNCTVNSGGTLVYTEQAFACNNLASLSTCTALFQDATPLSPGPAPGNSVARPLKCWGQTATPTVYDAGLNTLAKEQCANLCGLCCVTSDYNCDNARFPRLNCATITSAQCRSATWREIIATDCPSACGFCNLGGCIDAVIECANDNSICNAIGMQDFVNTNCRRTCGRCASTTTTTSSNSNSGSCTSYNADSSSSCSAWAANGFCTNNFYTVAQRKARCATTCRIC